MIDNTILHYKILEKLGETGLDRRSHFNNYEVSNDW